MTPDDARTLRLASRRTGNVVDARLRSTVARLLPDLLAKRLLRRCLRMMDAVGLAGAELSLLFDDDAHIASVNRRWLHRRGPTDVVSFPAAEGREDLRALMRPARPKRSAKQVPECLFGDLMISLETVKRRSSRLAAYEQDLNELLAHGFGHLLHRDHHGDAAGRREWQALQEALLPVALSRGPVRRVDVVDTP